MSGNDEITPTEPAEVEPSKKKVEEIFEQVEMMSFNRGGIDFNGLSDGHRGEMIELMKLNETHAFEFHTEKLKADKEIKLARISANNFTNGTNRIVAVIGAILITAITIVILIYKDSLFNIWLSFLTGLIGGSLTGYGYAKATGKGKKEEV